VGMDYVISVLYFSFIYNAVVVLLFANSLQEDASRPSCVCTVESLFNDTHNFRVNLLGLQQL
jgi:hypothetical protein